MLHPVQKIKEPGKSKSGSKSRNTNEKRRKEEMRKSDPHSKRQTQEEKRKSHILKGMRQWPFQVVWMVQAIQKEMTQEFYPQEDASFIRVEIGIVQRSHCFLVRIFDAQKEIKAWDFLTIIGEIFCHHLRLQFFDILLPQDIIESGQHDFRQLRVVV